MIIIEKLNEYFELKKLNSVANLFTKKLLGSFALPNELSFREQVNLTLETTGRAGCVDWDPVVFGCHFLLRVAKSTSNNPVLCF